MELWLVCFVYCILTLMTAHDVMIAVITSLYYKDCSAMSSVSSHVVCCVSVKYPPSCLDMALRPSVTLSRRRM